MSIVQSISLFNGSTDGSGDKTSTRTRLSSINDSDVANKTKRRMPCSMT